jgi:hypothetical protein
VIGGYHGRVDVEFVEDVLGLNMSKELLLHCLFDNEECI